MLLWGSQTSACQAKKGLTLGFQRSQINGFGILLSHNPRAPSIQIVHTFGNYCI